MKKNLLVAGLRDLIDRGPEAFSGAHAEAFVAEAGSQHPAGVLYRSATAKAIALSGLPDVSPEAAAADVYANFIWTHFVCKMLMTASPSLAVDFVRTHLDISEVQAALTSDGSALLSCFHYTGYPLVAVGLAVSQVAPLISKARIDILEQAGSERFNDQVVYLSHRSAAVRLARALKQGRSVWVMLDVVLPSVRVVRTDFLRLKTNVVAGLGTISLLSGRPFLPLFWEPKAQGTKLRTGRPVHPMERSEEAVIQEFVTTQAEFISQHPTQWLEWYSVLDEAPRVRAEVKRGNEELWACLADALR